MAPWKEILSAVSSPSFSSCWLIGRARRVHACVYPPDTRNIRGDEGKLKESGHHASYGDGGDVRLVDPTPTSDGIAVGVASIRRMPRVLCRQAFSRYAPLPFSQLLSLQFCLLFKSTI